MKRCYICAVIILGNGEGSEAGNSFNSILNQIKTHEEDPVVIVKHVAGNKPPHYHMISTERAVKRWITHLPGKKYILQGRGSLEELLNYAMNKKAEIVFQSKEKLNHAVLKKELCKCV